MREKMIAWFILLFTTLLVPCVVTLVVSGTEKEQKKQLSGIVLEYENGKKVDMEEFLPYMIAGEIDLDYGEETLKAQAVIARTNLMRELNGKKEAKVKELSLVYLTPEKFESSLGTKTREKLLYKLNHAVDKTFGEVLTYENSYIEALYHQVSLGTTVSSEEIFGKARPYLVAVGSSQDVESEEYMQLTEWNAIEVLERLKSINKASTLTSENIITSLKIKEKTVNGYVKEVQFGTETVTGDQWQQLFGLNSSNFYLEEYNGKLRMITLGKGHGIGLSQYGANVLASEEWNYKNILEKYYPGTMIQKIEDISGKEV